MADFNSVGSLTDPEILSGSQTRPLATFVGTEGSPEPSESPQTLQTEPVEQITSSEHPTAHRALVQDPPTEPPEADESRSPIRDGFIIAARKTFKTVEAVSGAIPGVGDFVGVAAKVGLAFVNVIEVRLSLFSMHPHEL